MILVNTGMGDKYSTFRVRYISSGAQASLVCKQGRIGNEKVICHVMGLGAPYRKFQSQLH